LGPSCPLSAPHSLRARVLLYVSHACAAMLSISDWHRQPVTNRPCDPSCVCLGGCPRLGCCHYASGYLQWMKLFATEAAVADPIPNSHSANAYPDRSDCNGIATILSGRLAQRRPTYTRTCLACWELCRAVQACRLVLRRFRHEATEGGADSASGCHGGHVSLVPRPLDPARRPGVLSMLRMQLPGGGHVVTDGFMHRAPSQGVRALANDLAQE
jgi:hypothetical protein